MTFEKDVVIPMRDGAELRANVFRPTAAGAWPVLMTFGPYGKDVHLRQFMPPAWDRIVGHHPEITAASSCRHLVFETPDPEVWVPFGYVVIKVDSRGAGKSPGFLDVNSPAEFRDFYDAIEWAGVQSWSSGKVGLLGISYYAAGQWMVASMRPPHLMAMLPWQGTYDFYRDRTRQDGIFASGFTRTWWPKSVLRNQYGNPETTFTDITTGDRNTGPAHLTPDQLVANRADYIGDILAHPLLDAWYQARMARLEQITVPMLVVANWGGLGLHLRGTIGGYLDAGSTAKWLRVQGGSYFITFLMPENVALQRRFFDRYLKDLDNGWETEAKVIVDVRSVDDRLAGQIVGDAWPLAETAWTRLNLDPAALSLSTAPPEAASTVRYRALGEGVTFSTPTLLRTWRIAGPVRLRVAVSCDPSDMDLFVTLRAFGPDGVEATFLSATEPKCPVSQGWLRVSHRRLDAERSTDFRPVHRHDATEPMVPGEIVEVEVEIWPTSLELPPGFRLALTVQGTDFQRLDEPRLEKGSGWFLHEDAADRPAAIFDSMHELHAGGSAMAELLLPTIGDPPLFATPG